MAKQCCNLSNDSTQWFQLYLESVALLTGRTPKYPAIVLRYVLLKREKQGLEYYLVHRITRKNKKKCKISSPRIQSMVSTQERLAVIALALITLMLCAEHILGIEPLLKSKQVRLGYSDL